MFHPRDRSRLREIVKPFRFEEDDGFEDIEFDMDEFGWGFLPEEILLRIFSFLDLPSLTSSFQVCRQWHCISLSQQCWADIWNYDFAGREVKLWRLPEDVDERSRVQGQVMDREFVRKVANGGIRHRDALIFVYLMFVRRKRERKKQLLEINRRKSSKELSRLVEILTVWMMITNAAEPQRLMFIGSFLAFVFVKPRGEPERWMEKGLFGVLIFLMGRMASFGMLSRYAS
eukprot:TRINITY_DN12516_c1_g2_i1.p1 TRINITY_DN12516_c1_g2~~TRINITY_DN12516_c1_g2_i1.p1  ORF type:complete len:257 (-),score=41.41 TRINITY_DN12516_c1_g2_i1:298-987(-)